MVTRRPDEPAGLSVPVRVRPGAGRTRVGDEMVGRLAALRDGAGTT
ncbi:hypothetical protein [Paractinoplanes rishiriensis]|nr:hypothetical protein [Actinoplanes rishiriensis]